MNAQSETTQNAAADQYDGGDGTDFDEPTGPPYRAIAMVLLAAVVLAIGIGLVQLFGGDDDEATPSADEQSTSQSQGPAAGQEGQSGEQGQQGADGTQPGQPGSGSDSGEQAGGEAPAPGAPEGQTGPDRQQGQQGTPQGDVPPATSVPVQVYNNSNVSGLAGRTGEQLRENGYAVGDVANLPSSQGVIPESAAYYGSAPGEQQAAQAVAAQLGIPAKPRPADFAAEAGGVVVIVTQDLAG